MYKYCAFIARMYNNKEWGDWRNIQTVKCLLHNHQDLCLIPHNPCEKTRCGGNSL